MITRSGGSITCSAAIKECDPGVFVMTAPGFPGFLIEGDSPAELRERFPGDFDAWLAAMKAARVALGFLGSIAAGMILCAGPAPADTPPTHPLPPISADGKDWTAPNGPGQ